MRPKTILYAFSSGRTGLSGPNAATILSVTIVCVSVYVDGLFFEATGIHAIQRRVIK
jgi:hypothetical protein